MPDSKIASCRHLHSASRQQLFIPRQCLRTFGRRSFSIAGLMDLSTVCDDLCDLLSHVTDNFRSSLKTFLFTVHLSLFIALEAVATMRYIIPC